MRIGVVADTHVGDELAELPGEVAEALAGVDLVLHAGDLCDPAALAPLTALAPVVAVRGNHDPPGDGLPDRLVVRAGGRRIGLTHGIRPTGVEIGWTLAYAVGGGLRIPAHCRAIGRPFTAADLVVFGHLHLPILTRVDGTLFFSPGAVYQPELDPAFDWSGARRAIYRCARRRLPAAARVPAVGLIAIDGGRLSARRVPLRRPLVPGGPTPPAPAAAEDASSPCSAAEGLGQAPT